MEQLAERADSAIESHADWRPGTFSLRDAWYPVIHSPTLKGVPLLRMVHSQPFYVWREEGRAKASHVHPASSRKAAPSPFVDARGEYPVIEKFGHVWVWYGDPALADAAVLPDIPFLPAGRSQPSYSRGVNFFRCTYELVLENILDLTHIDFVHGVFAGPADSEEDSIRFESTSETVTMIRTIKKKPTSKYQREALGITEKYQDQEVFTHVFIRSGVCFLHTHYSAAPSIPLMQSNTPESHTLTRANYVFGVQQTRDKNYARTWPTTAPIVAEQDAVVLDPQNARYFGQPPKGDASTRFDRAGLHFRERYQALVARQQRGDFAYARDYAEGSDLAEILKIKRLS